MADFDTLWNYDDPAASEAAFRQVRPQVRASGDASAYAELLTQIARAQGLQRKFGDAQATLDEAQALIVDGMARPRIRHLLESGRVLNSSGQRERSRPLFQQAYDLALLAHEDFYAVDAAHMLGIVEAGDAALMWNETAIKLAESSADPQANGWLGSLYNNTGWTHHDAGRHAEALDLFERGLAWRQARRRDERDDGGIRIARWCVARALRSLGRVEDALTMQRALLADLERAGARDGFVFEEIGECLLNLGRTDEAKPFFAQAHTELSQDDWLAANEPDRLRRLKELSSSPRPG
jgi:tetratricopeptide (TPR) repeat protein